jgi:peptidyl-prolyl cis-trans isomerase D
MLTFLRRILFSTAGKIVALALLVLIAVAFALGDITNLSGGGSPAGGALVQVGDKRVTEAELRQRLKTALDRARQQQPMLDMVQFVNSGGFDQVLEQIVNSLALEQFARDNGMAVSKAAVDGEIASIPAFQGLDGKFSQATFNQIMAREGLTADQVREDIARETLAQWLIGPTIGATQVPSQFALPYASLLLEQRRGSVGYIPTTAIAPGAAPTDAELLAFYRRNGGRYTLPERRVIRYAIVRPQQFAETAKATEAEIAEAYRRDAAKYAAATRRQLAQVIVADQNAANALAAKVKAGTSLAAAAQAIGLKAQVIDNADKAAFARANNTAIADAAFAAAPGTVVGPIKGPIAWHIVKVEKVEQVAGKSLDQVRGELAAEITKRKEAEIMADLRGRIDSGLADNATFDEAVAQAKLTATTSPPLFADGRPTQDAASQPDPVLAQIAQGGFAMEQSQEPQLIPIGQDGSFALIKTERVIAAAPRPLPEIRETVTRDFIADRQLEGARKVAAAVLADVNKGTPIADALKKTGLSLPALQPLDARRGQLAQMGAQIPAPVRLMFSMPARRAKLTEAPNGAGYWVVWLDEIKPGDATGNAGLIAQARGEFGQLLGAEYVEQFAIAVRKAVGIKRDEAAIARLKASLAGRAGS